MEVGGEEVTVNGAEDGSLVLGALLVAGNVVISGTSGLLVELASLEMEVLKVLVVTGVAVVLSVVIYGTMCSTVVVSWVKATGKKALFGSRITRERKGSRLFP